jgi:hypothetical protein|tara:strand:- start:1228 stop:1476 length:249 start_codon:yes stop_codon:yes gene_type:complete
MFKLVLRLIILLRESSINAFEIRTEFVSKELGISPINRQKYSAAYPLLWVKLFLVTTKINVKKDINRIIRYPSSVRIFERLP